MRSFTPVPHSHGDDRPTQGVHVNRTCSCERNHVCNVTGEGWDSQWSLGRGITPPQKLCDFSLDVTCFGASWVAFCQNVPAGCCKYETMFAGQADRQKRKWANILAGELGNCQSRVWQISGTKRRLQLMDNKKLPASLTIINGDAKHGLSRPNGSLSPHRETYWSRLRG